MKTHVQFSIKMNFFLTLHYDTKTGIGTYCSVGSVVKGLFSFSGRPSFLQVTTLHRHNSTHTTLHGPFLHIHNSTRHNSTPPQFNTQQLDTLQFDTKHFDTLQLGTSQLDTAFRYATTRHVTTRHNKI